MPKGHTNIIAGEQMIEADNWTATYGDFLALSDRFTHELDIFTDLMRANKAVLDQVGQYTEHVDATSKQISAQVEQVRQAWAKADQTAAQAAQLAYKSAFEGVRSSFTTVTEELSRSVQANNRATSCVKQSRNAIYWTAAGCISACFIATLITTYFANARTPIIEDEIRLKAARYELIWSNADKQEQGRLSKLLQGPVRASLHQTR